MANSGTKKGVLEKLHDGNRLLKMKKGGKTHPRVYSLSKDNSYIHWFPSRKGKDKAKIFLADVKEIRTGYSTDTFRESKGKKYIPECCFSVVCSDNETLNLVAYSEEEAKIWIKGLRWASKKMQNLDIHARQAKWVKEYFNKADKNQDGSVTFNEVCKLLKAMNIKMNKQHIYKIFEAADYKKGEGEGELDEEEFVRFYREITMRPEIVELFQKYSGDDDYWTIDEFMAFMHEEQKRPDFDAKKCMEAISHYEPTSEGKNNYYFSLDGFLLFMLGPDGLIFNPMHRKVYQDMDQPITHYFINSSHNTYLLEDQLKGPSSVEAYINALKKGCRCVELDCWDGSDNDPVVYHGHTLTSKIKFKDALVGIEQYAFHASEYPVILNVENHCSIEQQKVMAKHILETLGKRLYRRAFTADMAQLPSPNDLKGKILLRSKKLKVADIPADDVSDEDEAAEMEDEQVQKSISETKPKSKQTLAKELSDLFNFRNVSFKSFADSKANFSLFETSSFSESKASGLAKDKGKHFVDHNKWQISRIYPKGTRTDSSNYNPQRYWNCGCQIVALNYQTPCEEMDLVLGKFQNNGNAGYILKPVFMRKENLRFSPEIPGDTYFQQVAIKVISGQQFPSSRRDVIDPYVTVAIHGLPNDSKQEKTKVINNNSFNPVWNKDMVFVIRGPELATVRFSVYDSDAATSDDFVGQYTLPLISMQQGYHHIPLLSKEGESLEPASLFIHFSIVNNN